MTRSEGVGELAAALALAQGEMAHAKREAENPHFRHRYADLAAVWDACRAALTTHGLSVIQSPRLVSGGEALWLVEVETTLLHQSGQTVSDILAVPVNPASAQAVGSAITYARRYALAAFVGVAPEDDDAQSASPPPLERARPKEKEQKERRESGASPPVETARIKVLGIVKRPLDGREKFIISGDDEHTYQTFSVDVAKDAKAAKEAGLRVEVGYRATQAGRELVLLREMAPEPSA